MRGWTVAVAIALAGAGTLADAKPDLSFTLSGACTSADIVVQAQANAVRALVPSRFPLLEAAGRTPLLLGAGSCHDTVLNGVEASPYRYAEAAAFVVGPDGAATLYMLWQLADAADVRAEWDRLGIAGDLVPVEVAAERDIATGHMAVHVPWSVSPHTMTIDGIGPELPVEQSDGRPCDPATGFWHAGSRGDVRMTFKISQPVTPSMEYASRIATGEVRAAPGSPLAAMLGGESASGALGLRAFRFEACVAVVRPRKDKDRS